MLNSKCQRRKILQSMSKKKRISLRLDEDEIAVVGTRERWEHLILIYEAYAEAAAPEEKESWFDAAAWIKEYLDLANVRIINSEEDEWK